MTATHGRGDVNALAVRAAQQIVADRDAARARDGHGTTWDEVDSIAVMEKRLPSGIMWETLNMPFGLPVVRVYGDEAAAQRNGWSLRELMTRRLHRAYRDALTQGRIMRDADAAKRARSAQVYVAE